MIYRLIWPAALAATIVFASGNAMAQLPGTSWIPDFDKLQHMLVFGLLATLVCRMDKDHCLLLRNGIYAVAVTALFGITDELHQYLTPVRFFEVDDWVADLVGAILAVALYLNWTFYRKCLEYEIKFPSRKKAEQGGAE